ncbi:MAG: hypothetical protein NC822_06910 [Candidatus Omnitrophica bacterium]|nr:hypothetical protein [Candidatus Omnitrophota bacterium]MCM8826639.1 hypothetical protein [Candidatus Omnitrophota bacterium]
MVDVKRRVFLVTGSDFLSRKRVLDNIKLRVLGDKYSPLNTSIIYSKDVEENKLKETLLNFPLIDNRVFIFKEADKLNKQLKDFLFNNLDKLVSNNYLIFEIESDYFYLKDYLPKDNFFGYLLRRAQVIKTGSFEENFSISRFMRMLRINNLDGAFYTIEKIFEDNKNSEVLGMQILGAICKEFSYIDDHLGKEKVFNVIWETERALKEGRIEPLLALERLIIKILKN